MTSRLDPPAAHRRDARIAWWSIFGFWSFYFLINSIRTFILQDPAQLDALWRRVIVSVLSMAVTGVVYVFLRESSAASIRRSMPMAAALALPAAIAYSSINFVVFEMLPHPWANHVAHAEPPPAAPPSPPPVEPSDRADIPVPQAPPPPPETLNVGHTMEDSKSPFEAIAGNAVNGYFFFVAWASLFLSLRYAGEVKALERRSAELRAAAQNAELRALRYQVNPHFLFNTLNSLSSLILTGRGDQAERMILNLSTFFRTSLSGDPTEDVTLADEIALQRLYLDIEAVRFPERLLVDIDLPGALETALVPGLILQPLVENAVKHGVSRSLRPVTIVIRAREAGGRLVLTVENSAVTEDCDQGPTDGTGVGLRNVRDRLAARFGDEARAAWRAPGPGRFEVELSMPIVRHGC